MPQSKPMHHNYGACALEPGSSNYGAHGLQLLKSRGPRAQALQQEKPLCCRTWDLDFVVRDLSLRCIDAPGQVARYVAALLGDDYSSRLQCSPASWAGLHRLSGHESLHSVSSPLGLVAPISPTVDIDKAPPKQAEEKLRRILQRSRTAESADRELVLCKRSHRKEKPAHRNRVVPARRNQRKPSCSSKDPVQTKNPTKKVGAGTGEAKAYSRGERAYSTVFAPAADKEPVSKEGDLPFARKERNLLSSFDESENGMQREGCQKYREHPTEDCS
ncbi:hypothetical protein MJG53_014227 [Ovis ammon polii x Ovis aries]|uniref:Uncharacterized protein n=1 Tax=Ovis ammon polii x Ovis aries TaxID=2918886 RepID=A0ACB9UGB1_9CETA|nr:hypothetical protein MJG53_014227 [Ovis ammon polii x Ovis aries]